MHYFHGGSAVTDHLLTPDGEWQNIKLSMDIAAGEVLQLLIPGGYWKTTILKAGEYVLLGESVS